MNTDGFTSLIGQGVMLKELQIEGTVVVEGQVFGSVNNTSEDATLITTETSVVDCKEVKVPHAVIGGKLKVGELHVEGTLRLKKTARITADKIFYRTLEIEQGALLHECTLVHLDQSKPQITDAVRGLMP